ncbi:Probable inorganic phosphate transporter 1-3 [Ancistrocladus abbreviatus]
MSAICEVYKVARAQTLIALCGTVPGYWFTVAFIDIIRRAHRIGFIIMYAFTFFFANFGPNATTFIVPAEVFPTRLRSTCHGISAATGRLGAIAGAFGFLYISQEKDPKQRDAGYPSGIGKKDSLILLAGLNFIGAIFTLLILETKGKTLEEASGEVIELDVHEVPRHSA